jgi:hypothetical protein
MTALNLPNEIINKIFSYIEGNNNQIIKTELINADTFWSNHDDDNSTYNIKFAFDTLKYKLICKMIFNNKAIKYHKYYKYTLLHDNREYLFDDIKFGLRALIDDYNYYNKYYNYTKVLTQLRKNYIYDYNYEYHYNLTNIQLRKHYNTHFKYTILHENRKKVCNQIRRYNTKKHYIFNKKLLKNILLERGILINYIQTDNNKRQKKWH